VPEEIDSEAICLRFQLREREYRLAALRICSSLWFYRGFAVATVIVLLVGTTLFIAGNDTALPVLAVGIVWLLFLLWALLVAPILTFRRRKGLREEQNFCFDAEGVRAWTKDAESRLKWSFYEGIIELREMYLLRHQKRIAHPVPKRAFPTPQDHLRFRQLAQHYLRVKFRDTDPA
jgi:hypothetical protein